MSPIENGTVLSFRIGAATFAAEDSIANNVIQKTGRRKSSAIAVAVVIMIILIIVAVTLGVVLSQPDKKEPTAQNALDDLISEQAGFPNGTLVIAADSFSPGASSLSPRNLTDDLLQGWGISTDVSSMVAETGRLNFFYVWMPASVNRKTRSTEGSDVGNIGIRFGDAKSVNVVLDHAQQVLISNHYRSLTHEYHT
ncbi:hypothetical protein BV898_15314 [Hypsibius exemplaris]|uniref:Uncharacterized protein n=1 Tax=Hypsibius exemplaris TaxID=2072580 RepID=A0A9X6RK35_HYPEX|nr:hypothetical protein BV898_15314 [Hypsibius exemplaris]